MYGAEERQADLKLLEAPDIGTGTGGKPKVLIPKAVDADEENDDDDEDSESSSDDEVCYHTTLDPGANSMHCICSRCTLPSQVLPTAAWYFHSVVLIVANSDNTFQYRLVVCSLSPCCKLSAPASHVFMM